MVIHCLRQLPAVPFRGLVAGCASLAWRYAGPIITPWVRLSNGVQRLIVASLHAESIPNADIVVATAWQTAEMAEHYPGTKGRKLYLVYDYEYWMTASPDTRERIARTYHGGFRLISTSSAVTQMIRENHAEPAHLVMAGVDTRIFTVKAPIDTRPRGSIAFPVRSHPTKGLQDAIDALRCLRERFGSQIAAVGFGPDRRPRGLPRWIRYLAYPTDVELAALYNNVAIFLYPSRFEGWGLPGLEAMSCGAALVASDSGGIRDYAVNGSTAIVVEPGRPDLLAAAAAKLILQDDRRRQLARNGTECARRFSLDTAGAAFESVCLAALGDAEPGSDAVDPCPSLP